MNRAVPALLGALALVTVGIRVSGRPPLPDAERVTSGPATPADAAERGRVVYGRYGCALCHGADGKGGFANPNAETDGRVRGVIYVAEGYTPDELRRLILDGSPPIGKADPNGPAPPYRMPGWGDRMAVGRR